MVKKIICICTCLFLQHTYAKHTSIELKPSGIHYLKEHGSVKPTAFLHSSFQVKVISTGTKQSDSEPTIQGLHNFKILGESNHSSISIHNTSMSVQKIKTYTLMAKKEGTFTIGPATLKTNKSNTVTINVKTQDMTSDTQFVEKPKTKKTIWCTLKADKTHATIEEPILITLSIHNPNDTGVLRRIGKPTFPSCTVKDIDNIKTYKKHSTTISTKEFVIFPQKPGTLTISPAHVMYEHMHDADDLFSNFFSFARQQKTVASNPLTLHIKDIPAHTEHVDGIGTFTSFTSTVDKTNVMANEPITLTYTIKGKANFDLIMPPSLTLPNHYKSYESNVETNQHHAHGSKTFTYILQIPTAGTSTIPSQTFVYFDTKTKSYRKLCTNTISLHITMPQEDIAMPRDPEPEDISPTQDIHFIDEHTSPTKQKETKLPIHIFVLLLILVPCLLIPLMYLKQIIAYIKRTLFRHTNILPRYQKELKQLIEHNEPENMYKLYMRFMADILNMPPASVTEDTIMHALKRKGMNQENIASFMDFLHTCAQLSFAKQTVSAQTKSGSQTKPASQTMTPEQMSDIIDKAEYWFSYIHALGSKS